MAASPNIIRTPKDSDHPFLAISRALAQDKRLSYEARGVMLYLLSKPNNWEVRPAELEMQGCKRDKVYRILDELKKFGYLVREKQRRADGTIEWLPYRVVEQPQPLPEKPYTVQPDTAQPYTEKPEMEEPHQDAESEEPPHPVLPYTVNPDVYIVESRNNREVVVNSDLVDEGLTAAAAAICGLPKRMPAKRLSELRELVAMLTAEHATPEETLLFPRYWLSKNNPLYERKGDAIGNPYPLQVIEHWPQFLAWRAVRDKKRQQTLARPREPTEPLPTPAEVAAAFASMPIPDFVKQAKR